LKPTPLEKHDGIFVKREDLNEYGFPSGKLRGLIPYMKRLKAQGVKIVVNAGATHSNSHSVVAFAADKVGLVCHTFVNSDRRPPACEFAKNIGATIHTTKPMHLSPLIAAAREWTMTANLGRTANKPVATMLPWGLTCSEIMREYAHAVAELPRYNGETLHVVPMGAGGWVAGVFYGALQRSSHTVVAVPAMPTKNDENKLIDLLNLFDCPGKITELPASFWIVNHAPKTKEKPPFPCDPRYEYPAWEWAKWSSRKDEIAGTSPARHKRIIFWCIGSAV